MFYRVHLNDEAPAIGSGRRTVYVESIGPKYVRLRCPYTFATARLARGVWDKELRPIEYRPNMPALAAAANRRLADCGREMTGTLEAMLKFGHDGKL
ncbi:MAG: hypothetical protein Q8P46_06910 [Hyphomicrobiales bacterium]|nr:hypothetical protein [Hyphomicrobiales bacterium]